MANNFWEESPMARLRFRATGRLLVTVLVLSASLGKAKLLAHTPIFQWEKAVPEELGLCSHRLEHMKDELARRQTKAFLVVKDDKIVYEWYAPDHGPDRRHYTASLAKAVVAGLAVAIAIEDGYLHLDDPVAKYIPHWQSDPQKARITIRHLGSHTSGLDDSRPNEEAVWKDMFWKRLPPPQDPFTISRDQAPVLFAPGSRFHYSNPGIAMLTYAVAAALKKAPENDIRRLLRDRIYRPIGIGDEEWSIGYGQTFYVDELPVVAGWGGGSFTARALARIGRLVLHEGLWDGRQILRAETVRAVTRSVGLPGDCGIGWWTNAGGRFACLPRDAFWGAGAQEQVLLVIPSLHLIMVRNGGALSPADSTVNWEKYLFQPLTHALMVSESPAKQGRHMSTEPAVDGQRHPQSPVITGVKWANPTDIIRLAPGSDNWPMTWADDDHLYTAFGDGWGFEPKAPRKLSLGIARVEGMPPHIRGVNIPSPTGEQYGDGPAGKKASGMLMIDGVLFMLVRNAGNSQLAWSTDRGRTWQWASWKFTESFGCPTFVNFGKNYEGARDQFVYIVSPDSDSAYTACDRMVLARVPKHAICQREKYEFFAGFDEKSMPRWTPDIRMRQPVFENPGRCGRSSISYNPGLKRYIWWQSHRGRQGVEGSASNWAFAIYDAPEPWGPWTLVFSTEKWDVDPGESGCFPTKWISPDGTEMWLVFSGDDSFSVRKVHLLLKR
ncbi:MAG: serine hydrolase [Thermoguttaceae bacterium]|nr:serine hydrolase [Thermoguttaceae bacterium]MDW8077890.1 serine hydrolase [Thermoguttaceae bacterium]